ncbi:phosphonoacetaldehyde hydrolase [Geovibrio ferrireducens]|uniref:phosphonoacetaldehyde hydrolase n=1 Tax=Geovibrio ferrireducens TaxID=46201 RepID=UPI00224700B2|nr:phosphonoacetaldehyde hydrolase [Geovibrio ferrireducens]
MRIKAVIFDWAGTTVDYGCLAPVAAIISTLEANSIKVTPKEVRLHMGMKKRDHLGKIFEFPSVTEQFEKLHGRMPAEADIDRIYDETDRMLTFSLPQYSTLISGVSEVVSEIRRMGLKIGSTTGYTKDMMGVVGRCAAEQGYVPDCIVASDEVPAGRPAPWMCYEAVRRMGVFPSYECVKIGDTPSDIEEGVNAGMWSVGIITGGSEMGLTPEEYASMDSFTLMKNTKDVYGRLCSHGAHYIAVFNSEIPDILRDIDRRVKLGEKPSAPSYSRAGEGESNHGVLRAFHRAKLAAESAAIVSRDAQVFISQALSTPCLDTVVSCEGAEFILAGGKKVLDFHGNGVHQVGFNNPEVKNAVVNQLETLPFSPRRYANETAVRLAEKLIEITDSDMAKVLYAPAATLAVSSAIKLAMKITGRRKIYSAYGSFHGASLCALSAAGDHGFLEGISGFDIGENFLPYNSAGSAQENLASLELLERRIAEKHDAAALLIEPVRCTSVHVPDAAYFRRLDEICTEYGILKIFDETATGLGRSGKWFAYQHFPIKPDMLVTGKGLGGGIIPIACLMVRDGLDCARDISIGHYTHEKSPAGCAAGLAVIEFIEKNNLIAETADKGAYFASLLGEIRSRFPLSVKHVRHLGLMAALETEKAFYAEYAMYQALDKGLSFKVSSGNIITLTPALTITNEQLKQAADILSAVFTGIRS